MIKYTVFHCDYFADSRKYNLPITAPKRNCRFSASNDSFVESQTSVLLMNTCVKNPQLLFEQKIVCASLKDLSIQCRLTT